MERVSHILQHVEFDVDLEVERLFFHQDQRSSRSYASVTDGQMTIPERTSISFDSYFASFFEDHWRAFSDIGEIQLTLRVSGTGWIVLYRSTERSNVVERRHFDTNGGPAEVTITVPTDGNLAFRYGRLWFQVDAISTVTLENCCWATPTLPVRDVRTSLVFCTFNRVPYLRRVLCDLADDPEALGEVERVLVVNQGDPLTEEELTDNPEVSKKLSLLQQENLGGCGGFSRGMLETYDDDELTHFILLDDDIKLHPHSVFRAVQFARFARHDVAIGGHMLDLVDSNSLFEAGANFRPGSLLPDPVTVTGPLSDRSVLNELRYPTTVDYNGWWFFMASKEHIEEVGFPIPCFIRGDDMEYGMRLNLHGVRTVPIPGVAVWHEPFYMKLGGWQYYFEVRNRLSMHSLLGVGDWSTIKLQIRRTFHRDAMLSRYASCQFAIEALRDYVEGADVALETGPGPLERMRGIQQQLGPPSTPSAVGPADPGPSRAFRFGRLAVPVIRAIRLALPVRRDDPTRIHHSRLRPWNPNVLNRYVAWDPLGRDIAFERQPKLEREQLLEFERLMKQMDKPAFGPDAVDRDDGLPWLAFWRKRLGKVAASSSTVT